MAGKAAQSVSVETLETFQDSKWPAQLGEWAVAAESNEDWRTDLVRQWEADINDPYPIEKNGYSASLEARAILLAMGLVETPKVKFRDKIGFVLFAPDSADYGLFASRVRFTDEGLDLIEAAGAVV